MTAAKKVPSPDLTDQLCRFRIDAEGLDSPPITWRGLEPSTLQKLTTQNAD